MDTHICLPQTVSLLAARWQPCCSLAAPLPEHMRVLLWIYQQSCVCYSCQIMWGFVKTAEREITCLVETLVNTRLQSVGTVGIGGKRHCGWIVGIA